MDKQEFSRIIDDLLDEKTRDLERYVLQGDVPKATLTIGGKETCLRIRRELERRQGIEDRNAAEQAVKDFRKRELTLSRHNRDRKGPGRVDSTIIPTDQQLKKEGTNQ